MKLVMTLLVRDEEDLIRDNIEYHLSRGVDQIIATDNLSQDGTRAILLEYQQSGQLIYLHEDSDDYSQSVWVTRMARMAVEELRADWVFHVDADEFWWPADDRSIKSILALLPTEVDGLKVPRFNFVPVPWLEQDPEFYREMIYREVKSLNAVGNPLPPKVIHRGMADVQVTQGNHDFRREFGEVAIRNSDSMQIFHFPVRTYKSFSARIAQGGQAYERNSQLPPKVGDTWRKLWNLTKAGELRGYFESQLWDKERIQEGIESGILVHDKRLNEYILDVLESSRGVKSDIVESSDIRRTGR